MSDTPPSPPPPPLQPRSGCLTALMIVIGIILLLPGLCAIIFGGMALSETRFDTSLVPFIMVGLLVGALGVAFIFGAIRGRRS